MKNTMEIRKEIVKLSEQYEYLKNADAIDEEICEILEGKAEELLQEYKMMVCPQCVKSRMDDILMQFGKIVFETEGNSNMDDVRYFIYDERPV